MKQGLWKVLIFDAVLLVYVYFVQEDLAWRSEYAVSRGATVTTSFFPLTRTFQMVRGGVQLTSPPTLDWLQVVVGLLILVNVVFLLTSRSVPAPTPAAGAPPMTQASGRTSLLVEDWSLSVNYS